MIDIKEIRDIDRLMEMRMEVIECVFNHPKPETMQELAKANRQYYQTHLQDKSHVACFAFEGNKLCGSGAICLHDEMPSPDNLSGKCAYLMNIYVRPEYRHRGIASKIVTWLVDRAKSMGTGKIYLESTDTACDLYRGAGFREMENMMKYEDSNN